MMKVKKFRILRTIPLLIAVCVLSIPAQAQYGGGTGEPNDPYLIYTAEQMNAIGADANDWDKHFKLMADIDLSSYTGIDFNIIGINYDNSFTGVFDGNGHAISKFTYDCNGVVYIIGLFGYVEGENAQIKDLGLIDPNIDAGEGCYVGSLVGRLRDGTITGCYVDGGSVSGNDYVGGLVGRNVGIITNCYNTGRVSGDEKVGGLVGYNRGTINNCYSVGRVTGTTDVGGLVGINLDTITNSFWDIETSGQVSSAGGTGKTTAEMQMASTFVGWGCDAVWTIDEGKDYPRLWWENMPGETPTTQFYGGGCGTEADPYLIYTAEQMNAIGADANDWDKHFKMMANIDLSSYTETDFNIIGIDMNNAFTGVFNGSGHTISNFSYIRAGIDYIGLFGYVNSKSAQIKDLGLIDPNVDAGTGDRVGSLVGQLEDGSISNCYAKGGSVSGEGSVGGLVGRNFRGTITGCYVDGGSVSGEDLVGGLVGQSGDGTITNCYATGSVSGNDEVGGLVGRNYGTITGCYVDGGSVLGHEHVGGLVGNGGTITNCYSNTSVSGDRFVGGLVGDTRYSGTITCSYATSSVSGNNYVGGLLGYNWGEVTNSLWDTQTSGQVTSAGGTGKTTAEMQTESTFTDAGWDFVGESINGTEDIWRILEGQDYPRLWWEFLVVDDFESYNDFEPDRIFEIWIDGWGDPENGSEAGYADPNFLAGEHHVETTIVHGGSQSMPLFYDNSGPAYYSEATLYPYPRDWIEEDVKVLTLWFYGDEANTAEPMYVALNGIAVVYHDNPDAVLIEDWTEWTIDLQEFAAQGVNFTNVNMISIGFGDKNPDVSGQPGGSGLVFFDDIRLYRTAPEPESAQ